MNIETVDMLCEGDKVFWNGAWHMVEDEPVVLGTTTTFKLFGVSGVIVAPSNQPVFTNSISVKGTST